MLSLIRKIFVTFTVSILAFILIISIGGLIAFILYKIGICDIETIKGILIVASCLGIATTMFIFAVCMGYYFNY